MRVSPRHVHAPSPQNALGIALIALVVFLVLLLLLPSATGAASRERAEPLFDGARARAAPLCLDFGTLPRLETPNGALEFFVEAPISIMGARPAAIESAEIEPVEAPFRIVESVAGKAPALWVRAEARPGSWSATLRVHLAGGEALVVPLASEGRTLVLESTAASEPVLALPVLRLGDTGGRSTACRRLGFHNRATDAVRFELPAGLDAGFTLADPTGTPARSLHVAGGDETTVLVSAARQDGIGARTAKARIGFETSAGGWQLLLPLQVTQSGDIAPLGEVELRRGFRARDLAAHNVRRARAIADSDFVAVVGGRGGRGAVQLYVKEPRVGGGVRFLPGRMKRLAGGRVVDVEPVQLWVGAREKRKKECYRIESRQMARLLDRQGNVLAVGRPPTGITHAGVSDRSRLDPDRTYSISRQESESKIYLNVRRARVHDGPPTYYSLARRRYDLTDIVAPIGQLLQVKRLKAVPAAPVGPEWPETFPGEHLVALARVRSGSVGTAARRERLLQIGRIPPAGTQMPPALALEARRDVTIAGRRARSLDVAWNHRAGGMGRPMHVVVGYDGREDLLPDRIADYWVRHPTGGPWIVSAGERVVTAREVRQARARSYDNDCDWVLEGPSAMLSLYEARPGAAYSRVAGALLTRQRPKAMVLEAERNRAYVLTRVEGAPEAPEKLVAASGGRGSGNNRPPAVVLEPDRREVATSPSGAVLVLHSQTIDNDCDAVTPAWSAPGIVFDDPTSLTPSGLFPIGTTPVYCVVVESERPMEERLMSIPAVMLVTVVEPTGTGDEALAAPRTAALRLGGPNPLRREARLDFELPHAANVRLDVFDVSGRQVRALVDGVGYAPGTHHIVWDGNDAQGRPVANGVYTIRLAGDGFQEVRRAVVVR